MALFGSARDASLVRHINRELINELIDTEIAFYKLSLEDTRANMYDEADNKVYFAPIRLNCIIEKGDKSYIGDDAGYDQTREGFFNFLRDDLKDNNIIIEEGDVIEYDNEYYDIDGFWGDMINFHIIDWTQLRQHFQTEAEIEAEFENMLKAIKGE